MKERFHFHRLIRLSLIRILNKLKWLTRNIEDVPPLPLKWKYEELFKLRIGDWRVIYDINHELKMITVHKVGHRSEIYI